MGKYYVVFSGKRVGIYNTWAECQAQISGYAGASFASFKDLGTAKKALAVGNLSRWRMVQATEVRHKWVSDLEASFPCLAVDAACSGCPGPVEYRGVALPEAAMVFSSGPYERGSNNIGEFLAIVTGLRWMENRSLEWPLYSDSKVAIGWVQNGGECNTTLENIGALLEAEINTAEKWLRGPTSHRYTPLIRKWDTEQYGEIPADYDRK